MVVDVLSVNDLKRSSGIERYQEERAKEMQFLNGVYLSHINQINRYLYLSIHDLNSYIEDTPEYSELDDVLQELSTVGISQRLLNKIRTVYISREEGINFSLSLHDEAVRTATLLSDDSAEVDPERVVYNIYLRNVDDFDRFYAIYRIAKFENWDDPRNQSSRWEEYHLVKKILLDEGIDECNIMLVVEFFINRERLRLETQEAQKITEESTLYLES
jgi:hypothetical protein